MKHALLDVREPALRGYERQNLVGRLPDIKRGWLRLSGQVHMVFAHHSLYLSLPMSYILATVDRDLKRRVMYISNQRYNFEWMPR